MLFEQIVEIIEFTDSEHLAKAMDIFNQTGTVSDEHLPFLSVVFEQAPEQLIARLVGIGFKGQVVITRIENAAGGKGYLLIDAERIKVGEPLPSSRRLFEPV
ncbi:hypothetical protein [Vibrio sp. 10N.261.51.F12]|uniref:hypothetical protein n=1 Tax=Vibrio sp. 10N.261.51.F12 TaxID=3229679 RepID=UPI00354E252A